MDPPDSHSHHSRGARRRIPWTADLVLGVAGTLDNTAGASRVLATLRVRVGT
jgi:hypothetical protein